MTTGSGNPYFEVSASPEALRREKEKAKALRKTQWWQRQLAKGTCHYCGKRVPSLELTMDHVVPLVRGGGSTRGNVVPSCKQCNSRKKYLLPVEWDEYLQGLSRGTDDPSHPDRKPKEP
ncbi:MAG TPA: HNH endonuclease [Syntrophobacteraceae bacterium]|nr:HNH endonuclease [Syntrophobacteraceae bacterium]